MTNPTGVDHEAPVLAHHEILIDAPLGDVWSLHTDVNTWTSWKTDISEAHIDGVMEPGNSFDWTSYNFQFDRPSTKWLTVSARSSKWRVASQRSWAWVHVEPPRQMTEWRRRKPERRWRARVRSWTISPRVRHRSRTASWAGVGMATGVS